MKRLALVLLCGIFALPALADITFTDENSYLTAVSSAGLSTLVDETFQNTTLFYNGQLIAPGTTIDLLTYTNFSGFSNADITNIYNAYEPSGLSLGADHTADGAGQTYFYGGDAIQVDFSQPVYAAGVVFNVNPDSGNYGFTTSTGGSASTGSAAYDTRTFVFAGIISSTPFSWIDITSSSSDGSFNIPEITAATTPEPGSVTCLLIYLAGFTLWRRKQTV